MDITILARSGDSESVGVVGYKIYHNSGSGDIDYTTVISTISTGVEVFELTLEAGDWEVGIRAYNAAYEEDNVDTATGVADATTPDNVSDLSAEAVNYKESSDLPV